MIKKIWQGPEGHHPVFGNVYRGRELDVTKEQAEKFKSNLGEFKKSDQEIRLKQKTKK
jgi:hypothetical protein